MRMPRSGFQQITTITGTLSIDSTASWPVTGRPAPSIRSSGFWARSASIVANASTISFLMRRLVSASVTTTNSHGWVLPELHAKVPAWTIWSITSGSTDRSWYLRVARRL